MQSASDKDEDYIIVWIDEDDIDTKHSANTLFGHATHDIQTFDDIEKCIDYIQTAKSESIFLIIAESLIQQCVFQFHELPQLHSIYIISSHELPLDVTYATIYKKVRGNYSDILSLFEHLTQDIRVADASLTPISVLNPNSTACKSLNTQDNSFIYSHLLKNVMLEFDNDVDDDRIRRQFVDFCRKKYAKNKGELKIIDDFDKHYKNHSPVWWYTRECFLLKMLNKAVRIQDIDILFKMKFFMRDLLHQIRPLHSNISTNMYRVLYRGQGLPKEQLEKLKANVHSILSFNNFFLANSDHDISLHFAQHSRDKDNIVPVIFEISIDPSIRSAPFIPLEGIGYFPTDTDVLFSMYSIFHIQDIQYTNNRIWNIQLTSISNDDTQMRSLNDLLKIEIQGFNAMYHLGSFMLNIEECDKAKDIFELAINESPPKNTDELAYVEDCLGRIYYEKTDWNSSFEHYQKSLNIKLTYMTDNDPQLALAHTNLASLFEKKDILDSALEQYQYALDVELKSSVLNKKQMAICYMNIGDLLCRLKYFEKARQNLKNALKIQVDIFPSTHPDLAKTRKHLFDVCCSMGKYLKALEQAKALLHVVQKTYPTNHFQLAIAHYNISICLDKLEKYQEALEEVEKALNIGLRTYSLGHPEMSDIENLLELVRWKNAQLFNNNS